MLTEEQLEERLNYITGTDCAIILGLSPYCSRVQLWQEKTRQIAQKDISDNPYVKAGHYLEPAIRAWFEAEKGLKVYESNEIIVHPIHSWMAGNIDGWVGEDKKEILEIKTASSDKGWGAQGINKIPDHYMCQIAHYMAVTCAKVCHVAVLIRGTDFRTYRFERNIDLEDKIIEKEQAFWELVQKEVPPLPEHPGDSISLYGKQSVNEITTATNDVYNLLEVIETLKKTIKTMEAEKGIAEEKVKLFMGEKENLIDFSGKILATWKPTAASKRFDANAFKKENEAEYSKYIKVVESSRRFCIKSNDEGL